MKAIFALLGLLCLVGEAHAQLIDPNQRCYYPPGSRECVPIPPQQLQPPYATPIPPTAPQVPPPPQGNFALCWTLNPVPNTKNMIISDVFQTQQTESFLENELAQYYQGNGISVKFKCQIDQSQPNQLALSKQKISTISLQGYNINQVRVKPH